MGNGFLSSSFFIIKSTTEDAQVPTWFHIECLFKTTRLFKTVSEDKIQNFGTLSNKDKEFIRREISKRFISY